LFSEHLLPGTLRDLHVLPVIALQKAEPPSVEEVLRRATDLRDRALYQGAE
jgi:hypothetical protein